MCARRTSPPSTRTNLAHITQSRPHSGLGFQALKPLQFFTFRSTAARCGWSGWCARRTSPYTLKNLAHTTQSSPDSGLGFQVNSGLSFQVNVLTPSQVVPLSIDSGTLWLEWLVCAAHVPPFYTDERSAYSIGNLVVYRMGLLS